jgi:hypothetical protein
MRPYRLRYKLRADVHIDVTHSTARLATLLVLKWRRPLPASSTQTTKHAGGVARYVCVRRNHGRSYGVGATLLILALGWRSADAWLALG